MEKVVIYTRDLCGYCTRAKRLLDNKEVEYAEYNASDDPSHREAMIKKANGKSTFPQIFIDSEHIGGCDDLMALERRGGLDVLLAG
ncbi:glutaredoxin 3 [Flexibacterium corallicola]|uniref:glutaredoxin 3 n=1 Tax=Flexibacterium corallicola TaxID=3037259 RepID=UPI00286F6E61|nr:glutaredoxin 3 [Pseudovibrio sp. M1P-2-3]